MLSVSKLHASTQILWELRRRGTWYNHYFVSPQRIMVSRMNTIPFWYSIWVPGESGSLNADRGLRILADVVWDICLLSRTVCGDVLVLTRFDFRSVLCRTSPCGIGFLLAGLFCGLPLVDHNSNNVKTKGELHTVQISRVKKYKLVPNLSLCLVFDGFSPTSANARVNFNLGCIWFSPNSSRMLHGQTSLEIWIVWNWDSMSLDWTLSLPPRARFCGFAYTDASKGRKGCGPIGEALPAKVVSWPRVGTDFDKDFSFCWKLNLKCN